MPVTGWHAPLFPIALLAPVGLAQPALAQEVTGDGEIAYVDQVETVLVCPDGKYQSGCDASDLIRAVERIEDLPTDIETRCLYETKARCYPVAFGRIITVEQGPPLTWQHMVLFPEDGPRVEMMAILEGVTANDLYVLVARQTEGWFAPPQLVENTNELMLLHAPGRTGGTGMGNADIVLSRHEQGWTTFDVNELLFEAGQMLPAGFSLASGVNFDFREMFVAVPVKRESDGGCCATGGTAFIDLAMPAGNRMKVASVTFNETKPVETHRIQAPGSEANTHD